MHQSVFTINFLTGSGKPKTVKTETTNNIKVNITKNGTTNLNATALVGVSGGGVEEVDLDKLAKAVAFAETSSCTKGYALTHNNCFGLKRGSIVKCPLKKGSKMCNFATIEEGFEAFKKVWRIGYKSRFPNKAIAETWTGGDRVDIWLANVKSKYYE